MGVAFLFAMVLAAAARDSSPAFDPHAGTGRVPASTLAAVMTRGHQGPPFSFRWEESDLHEFTCSDGVETRAMQGTTVRGRELRHHWSPRGPGGEESAYVLTGFVARGDHNAEIREDCSTAFGEEWSEVAARRVEDESVRVLAVYDSMFERIGVLLFEQF